MLAAWRDQAWTEGEIGRLAGIYDVTELATAVSRRCSAGSSAGGGDHVIYLDPDIKVFPAAGVACRFSRA